ncbi:sugar phosphate isomerase/epimerase [Saccharopolyspora erythraea NRRL 2338]|uniref:Sugar phosphate isomerase/epimerase n=2 Tax=Saccharopolyspora erythraea TaxID=1836 RepID=A4FE03_SACEN|nr:sugar phosphate isomerase/epimerase [Saccharopolyspora erythraea]EQD81802.1 sugar phosphate isomerase [Saccharopolyspora erythraea D]PFG96008.1 sugar phosphate isomerase/epimerase [Saccharopolyspora erythraea NRRL 2338]QRK92564.1 sugar phosphate isomerase/epimerase [Saccharopolyspora erythraea]CAM02278.1 sugar phosphate isomerase/epimerase [Saccharopolyspora erythraea NRRL 2338]
MHLTRRNLLRTTAALTAAGLASTAGVAGAAGPDAAGRHRRARISIQLYTLRNQLDADADGTLAALSEIGYRHVEMAGTHGRTAAQFRALLDKHGLRATSSHVGIDGDLDALIADARTLGNRSLVVPYASFATAAEWRSFADRLNEAGRRTRRAGLAFGYHNHDHEFAPVEGVRPYDILVRHTDPSTVHFELDLFWAVHAGQDPVALVDALRPRIRQLHVKDRTAQGQMCDPGTGTIDFPTIFRHARAVEEHIVEHDDSPDPLGTARVGHDYLRGLRGGA